MTLTHLLGINTRLVRFDEWPSMSVADRAWRERGCSSDARVLIDVLEEVLQRCGRQGIRYAPILLQRKKALQRGTWKPEPTPQSASQDSNKSDRDHSSCQECGGSGYRFMDGGRSAEGEKKLSDACEYFGEKAGKEYPQVGRANLKLATDRCRIIVMQIILSKMVEGLAR